MQWLVKSKSIINQLSDYRRILLANRQINNAPEFSHPTHPSNLDWTKLGIDKLAVDLAINRINQALLSREKIVIFGDYDADGICATAILWRVMHELGCQVTPFIPDRKKNGYGLSIGALTEILAKEKPRLIITVDNGIVARSAAAFLEQQKIDLIITDHHLVEADQPLPVALAILQTSALCGASLAWFIARSLIDHLPVTFQKSHYQPLIVDQLDLAGLATIADQVPLLGANRSFAAHGLRALQTTVRPGVKALLELAGVDQSQLDEFGVSFNLAPRLNAMGRLKHGLAALKLLCTKSSETATSLAAELSATNSQRQVLTTDLLVLAESQVTVTKAEHLIIVHSTDFHEGVIGLIAGKLTEKYHKPAIVMSVGERTVKASARSIPDVNIIDLIRQVRHDLLEVGGHPMAAGFGLATAKLETVVSQLRQLADAQIDQRLLTPRLLVDCYINSRLLSPELIKLQQQFAPFGQANPEPIIGLKNLRVLQVSTVGRDQQHLKIVALPDRSSSVTPINCLFWQHGHLAAQLRPGDFLDVAGVVELKSWQNRASLQIRVKDLRVL